VDDALRKFGAAVNEVLIELDWKLLGRAYCEGDGAEFFDDELRARIVDTALMHADDLADALRGERGRSLYLGAEIAELPLILAEHLVMGRRVEWLNIDGPQTREVVRALDAVGARLELELPKPDTRVLSEIEPESCDHLWMVSVLTDPDHFPALHDVLYERTQGPLSTGRGRLEDDRARADALVEALLDRAASPCVLTTSDEERTIVEPLAARRGFSLEFTRGGRLSSIVGDRVRIGQLRRAHS
jgi:hypothetical protein